MSPHLEKVRAEAEQLAHGLSSADWHYMPAGKWSASQTFEHLLLTFTATTKGLLRNMKAGEPFCREATLRDAAGRFYVLRLGRVPVGLKAAKNITPKEGLLGNGLEAFYDALVAMDATLTDAERRFGRRTKILDHPILGPLTAEQWRRFHRVHAQHHFGQIATRRPGAHSASAA